MDNQKIDDPDHLYKYRALRNDKDLERILKIIDGQLFAAGKDQFNDPFDCYPVAEFNKSKGNVRNYLKELATKHVGGNRSIRRQQEASARTRFKKAGASTIVAESIEHITSSTGIISLSAKPDHLLMWGHYGSEHTGVCLRFRRDLKSRFIQAFDVTYSELRPVAQMPIVDPVKSMTNIFLTKATCWSYEEEWRIVERNGRGPWEFNPKDLDAIIFGARCSESSANIIRSHVARQSDRDVAFFRARLASTEYSIEISPWAD